ncbi:Uncharacterised protein [Candidatus Anstonella stagnisolia]|nr:Uncharacterised protein [Candidatus Anstonella stagnisolia]
MAGYGYKISFGNVRGGMGAKAANGDWLTPEVKDWCQKTLEKFEFVKWDRFTKIIATNMGDVHVVSCYGWIDRESDAYKDFVVIAFVIEKREVHLVMSSSAKYSERIIELCDHNRELHNKCIRIEDVFEISNSIKLGKKKDA